MRTFAFPAFIHSFVTRSCCGTSRAGAVDPAGYALIKRDVLKLSYRCELAHCLFDVA